MIPATRKISALPSADENLNPDDVAPVVGAVTKKASLRHHRRFHLGVMFAVATDHGLVGDDSTSNFAALQALAAEVGIDGTIFFPAGVYVVEASITVSCAVVFAHGARLRPGAGVTVTLSPAIEIPPGQSIVADGAAGTVAVSSTAGRISLPSGFGWFTDTVSLFPDGTAGCSFDFDAHKPVVTKRYYVRHTGGSDSNDGLTYATALRTVAAALAKSDVDEIVLQPGMWDRSFCAWGTHTLTRDIAVTVLGGRAVFLGSDLEVSGDYAPDGTYSNTYKRTRNNLAPYRAVWDSKYPDTRGDWMRYELVASAAVVDSTPGSYYSDGTYIWVRCIDDRAPDDDLQVFLNTGCIVTGPFTFWVENVDFAGVQNVVARGATEEARPRFFARNCTFKYCSVESSPGRGGFRSEGADTFLVDCVAARNYRDGFNYHSFDGTPDTPLPRAFEWNCTGRHNGLLDDPASGLGNNQGSTVHDGGSVIRLNCTQFENEGPGIEDVGDGSMSYNVGNLSHDCRKHTTPRNYQSGSSVDTGESTSMWLVACKSRGRRDNDAITSGAGKIRAYLSPIASYSGAAAQFRQFNPFLDPD